MDGRFAALRENLEGRGTLRKIRAELRAEIFQALDDKQGVQQPALSDENLIINELVREYLTFNKYRNTLSVLMTEAGQPAVPLDRAFLADRSGAVEDGSSVQLCERPPPRETVYASLSVHPAELHACTRPLLYTLVAKSRERKTELGRLTNG